jgi:hypothetical protein
MTRQSSKGTCTFCYRDLSKASMTRHLESCEQRTATQGERESRQKAKKIKALHLVVEGYLSWLLRISVRKIEGLCQ